MSAARRHTLTVGCFVHIVVVIALFGDVTLPMFNALLMTTVLPGLWLLGSFCRWSAHQHAARYARDVDKVHRRVGAR